ncbi:MAG: hypothetical protein COT81_02370 [Candidatus Buchananbacteria bacterium CG10_big_fil_rev_8_21_14_0_10_42_9]|uniref:Major facilitator superfamily (MFS) profile domain-containing protein n=1 Tax=Candidatus Buchananbacteria bacterium CG10_big_fil_rev_8_21_14_0_10_42_9 TaxID=1974526 RepID=A0A2H0W1D0_9BACT|nr:MAG: hypothetical protein COT81_02370 [Candidatus Buchananbacteria bacterium CG10_big_fil_rev_8_21_14_0_10_42_9]
MSLLANYRAAKPKTSLLLLSLSRVVLEVSGGTIGLFLATYLLTRLGDIRYVLAFFLVNYLLYVFLAAPGAMLMSRLTIKRSIILSIPFISLFYLSLYWIDKYTIAVLIFAISANTIYKMLYWVPYRSNLVMFSQAGHRGRQLSQLSMAVALISVATPAFSGLIITYYSFNALFLVVGFFSLLAIVPLFFIPQNNESYTFSYSQTWRLLFAKQDRSLLLGYMSDGMEWTVRFLVWPLFVWQLVEQNFQTMGFLFSLIVFTSVLITAVMGDYTDKYNKHKIMALSTIFYSAGWIFKMFVHAPWQIFFASTYHRFARITMRTPYIALAYDKSADAGCYIDEYSALREMSIHLGRSIMLLILIILFTFTPHLEYSFILGALSSLMFNLL